MGIYIENVWQPQWAWATAFTNSGNITTFSIASRSTSLIRTSGFAIAENIGFDSGFSDQKFTPLFAGLYYLNVSASFLSASNDEFAMKFSIDGIDIGDCIVKWTQKGGRQWEVSMAMLYKLNGNEVVDVMIQNDTDTTSITLKKFTMTMIKLY